ncbi:unnamed protein product, partial [Rotaria magnacalcarata]
PININNNNSTNINSSTSSSLSSTPQVQYTYSSSDNFRKKKLIFNQYRQRETQDIQQTCSTNKTYDNKQSTTSSYISDDCKVLYIETVIEVPKPVFYEQATNTISTT